HLEAASDQSGEAGFITRRIEEIAQDDGDAGLASLKRAPAQRFVKVGSAAGGERAQVLEELDCGLLAAHGAQSSPGGELEDPCSVFRVPWFRLAVGGTRGEWNHADAVEARESDIADGCRDLPG